VGDGCCAASGSFDIVTHTVSQGSPTDTVARSTERTGTVMRSTCRKDRALLTMPKGGAFGPSSRRTGSLLLGRPQGSIVQQVVGQTGARNLKIYEGINRGMAHEAIMQQAGAQIPWGV